MGKTFPHRRHNYDVILGAGKGIHQKQVCLSSLTGRRDVNENSESRVLFNMFPWVYTQLGNFVSLATEQRRLTAVHKCPTYLIFTLHIVCVLSLIHI